MGSQNIPLSYGRTRQIGALSILCWALSGLMESRDIREFIVGPAVRAGGGGTRSVIWQDAKGTFRAVQGLTGRMGIYELECGVGNRKRWHGVVPVIESKVVWRMTWNPQLSGIESPPVMSDEMTWWFVFDALCSHPQTAVNPNEFVITKVGGTRRVIDWSALYRPVQVMLAFAGFLGFCVIVQVRKFAERIVKAKAAGNCAQCDYPLQNNACPECGFGVKGEAS